MIVPTAVIAASIDPQKMYRIVTTDQTRLSTSLKWLLPSAQNAKLIDKKIETRIARQKCGLTRALINNMVIGVSEKFERRLQMIGVGYRSAVSGNSLTLNVGFSHPVVFEAPKDIEIKVEANTNIIISGPDKEKVGLLASQIRAVRPPEPYKGKGIRYLDEYVLRKAGKSGK